MSHVDQMTVENLVEWEFEARVLRVLEDAIRQAKRRNQSTFVRVNWPSESFDLLDAVNHGCALRKRTFAWSDADDRRSFVALDVLEERETSGAVRFAQVGLWSSELRERVLEVALVEGGPQANLPLTVGGFAFAAFPMSYPRFAIARVDRAGAPKNSRRSPAGWITAFSARFFL